MLCGKKSPWINGSPCVLEAGHHVCPAKCGAHARKGLYRKGSRTRYAKGPFKLTPYCRWETGECGKHKNANGQEWPIGTANREYA